MIITTLTMLPFLALANPITGKTGDISWSLEDETLTLKGTGSSEMADFSADSAPWAPYKNSIVYVAISGVKHIGNYAFYQNPNLYSVDIKGVEKIGHYAFFGCMSLRVVDLNTSNIKSIGMEAFYNCPDLDEFVIPDNVRNISFFKYALGLKDGQTEPMISNEDFTISSACDNTDVSVYISNLKSNLGVTIYWMRQHDIDYSKYTVVSKADFDSTGRINYPCKHCEEYQQDYVQAIRTVTLSKTKYTYANKAYTPAVTVKDWGGNTLKKGTDYTVKYTNNKNVGKASATVTFKGKYSGKKVLKFTIAPKNTSITKLTPGKKKIGVQWKKQAVQTSGYQIQVSTSVKFTAKATKTYTVKSNQSTKKAIKNLAGGKTYFVRIRTYKTVNGATIASNWTAAKTVKTKK